MVLPHLFLNTDVFHLHDILRQQVLLLIFCSVEEHILGVFPASASWFYSVPPVTVLGGAVNIA